MAQLPRQQVSIDEIKEGLLSRLDALVYQLAPPATGSHTTHGKYFTLNPGRADRKVGSFCVTMTGPDAGRWCDFATKDRGDILDLIKLATGCSAVDAIKEARRILGLDTEGPEDRRRRQELAEQAKARRTRDLAQKAAKDAKRREIAKGVFLSGQDNLTNTPVDHYLRGRGIDLARLPFPPRAIRFHPECRYYWTEDVTDPSTGEVRTISRHRPMPAMVTAIARDRDGIIDCHRTYLARQPDGRWTKADLPSAKKVMTDYTGASIRLCGMHGPRGGMTKLKDAPAGSRVFVTEGIENALSLMMIRSLRGQAPAFVVAAGSIWNMSNIILPDTVAEVTLAADNDTAPEAQDMLQRAIDFHAGRGRTVRVWRSDQPGQDLNDELQRVLRDMERGAA